MKLHKTVRTIGTVALATGLALGAAACNDNADKTGDKSGDSSNTTKVDPQAAVETSLKELEGKSYTMTVSMGEYGEGNFEVDLPNKAQHATMDIVDPATPDADPMKIESIAIDTDMWVKMSGAGVPELGGGKWLHTTAKEMGGDISNMDMSKMTEQMMDSLADVKSTGDNTYTATMDLASLAETFGTGTKETDQLEPFEVKITLNDDQLLQKMEFDVPGVLPGGKDMTMAMEITGYDVDVKIEAPPADEVTEMDGM